MTTRTTPHVDVRAVQSCPLCHDDVTRLPQLLACPDCHAIHHDACVQELGHCGTMACRGLDRVEARGSDAPIAEPSRALSVGAYLGLLVGAAFVLPLLVSLYAGSRRDAFARHHARQAIWLTLLPFVTAGLALPFTLICTVYGGVKAWQGEWWIAPTLRGDYPFQRWFRSPDAKRRWELQRKAGDVHVPRVLRPLGRLLEPK